ncbi:Outer spore wall protein LDS1 [Saccharomyces cerevisiae]|nr:Outer spore wall protein LDS1 [Saccharomyces cerevisiae]
MSFTGSLALAGIGGLVYKFGGGQSYEKLPYVNIPFNKYLDKVYKKHFSKVMSRTRYVLMNFFKDAFTGGAFMYPFKGFLEFNTNKSSYSTTMLGILSSYLIMFALVSFVYWATITPMYTAFLIVLGPIGLFIAIFHSFLQANVFTLLFMRLSHFNNHLVEVCLEKNGLEENLSEVKPIKYYVPINSIYFWAYYFPFKLVKYMLGLSVLFVLLVISFFPLIGPILFHILISPFITQIYFTKVLRLQNFDNIQRRENIYLHAGQYASFGFLAGLIESVPILAGFAISTNTIGSVLFNLDHPMVPENLVETQAEIEAAPQDINQQPNQ